MRKDNRVLCDIVTLQVVTEGKPLGPPRRTTRWGTPACPSTHRRRGCHSSSRRQGRYPTHRRHLPTSTDRIRTRVIPTPLGTSYALRGSSTPTTTVLLRVTILLLLLGLLLLLLLRMLLLLLLLLLLLTILEPLASPVPPSPT